jgi:hypothetical protein
MNASADANLRVDRCLAFQDLGLLLIPMSLRLRTHADGFVKIISIYTLKVLCFSEVFHDGQSSYEKTQKKNLNRSFIVVACLWASLGLLVTINVVTVDRAHHFYGPTGYCESRPCPLTTRI